MLRHMVEESRGACREATARATPILLACLTLGGMRLKMSCMCLSFWLVVRYVRAMWRMMCLLRRMKCVACRMMRDEWRTMRLIRLSKSLLCPVTCLMWRIRALEVRQPATRLGHTWQSMRQTARSDARARAIVPRRELAKRHLAAGNGRQVALA